MPRNDPRIPNSKETKRKKSESAFKRWNKMTPEEEIRFRKRKSAAMVEHWKKFTKEERHAIARKRAVTYMTNRLRTLGKSESEIQELVKERYGE